METTNIWLLLSFYNQYLVVIILQPVGATQIRGPQNNCSTTTGRPARHADLQVVVLLAQPLS